jgi:hypothetical protein
MQKDASDEDSGGAEVEREHGDVPFLPPDAAPGFEFQEDTQPEFGFRGGSLREGDAACMIGVKKGCFFQCCEIQTHNLDSWEMPGMDA